MISLFRDESYVFSAIRDLHDEIIKHPATIVYISKQRVRNIMCIRVSFSIVFYALNQRVLPRPSLYPQQETRESLKDLV